MYIDTHCHVFSEYYDDIEKVISECKDNNVNRIIVNGCDIVSNKEVLELVNKYDVIYKESAIEKENKVNKIVLIALIISLLLNIINLFMLMKIR